MKQSIRLETFETNSSSYHTLSLTPVRDIKEKVHKQIRPRENLVIDTDIDVKYVGYTESYSYTAESNYERAQLLLRWIATDIEDQSIELLTEEEMKLGYTERVKLEHSKREETPVFKAFIKSIKMYIGDEYEVLISGNIKAIYACDRSNYEILNLSEDQLNNVDELANIFYDIIFTEKYIMTEECESNE